MTTRAYTFVLLTLLFCSCKKAAPALFELLPPEYTGIDFSNTLSENDSLNILNYVYYYNGGGVGIADFNNDGREDIFFTGNENSCRLYLNKGELQFEDVTKQAGLETTQWCTGVAVADVNADGWMDIYVCTAGHPQPERRKNLLFINEGKQGATTFTESAAAYGIADTAYSTQAAFFDYDRDGDLDLYVMNHANERQTLNTPLPKKTNGEGSSNDRLYRNEGGKGAFTDVTKEAGILSEGYGLGIAVSDVNGDGWPDIYIANDFIYNDLLYINQGAASKEKTGEVTFSNHIARYIRHQTYNGMGCDFADYNNDARPDLVVMDMLPETDSGRKTMAGAMTWSKWQLIEQAGYEPQYMRNTLQLGVEVSRQKAEGDTMNPLPAAAYAEIGQLAGIAATDWSWAPLFADFDNDGWKDLYITNGYLRDITDKDFIDYSNNLAMFKSPAVADRELLPQIRQLKGKNLPNRIFQNNRDLTFIPRYAEWGMTQASCSNGAAYADLDADGDLDIVVNNLNEPAFVFENKSDKLLQNNYISLKLEGLPGNGAGIGASVTIVAGGQRQYLEQYLSRGFLSTVTSVLHVGLGKSTTIDTLQVRWSDGGQQVLAGIAANQTLTLQQAEATAFVQKESPAPGLLLEEATGRNGIEFFHKEQVFHDFQYQPLLPHGFSENGPPLAVGDLDGDGREDFFIGGTMGRPGRLFYQSTDGHFTGKELPDAGETEDTHALLLDADGDGSNDLYVVGGSNEWESGSPHYQDRLYLNDGNGHLKWAKNALPEMHTPGACAAAADYDGDGDTDLFVGGSAEPGRYPLPARSYLLRNDHGKFSDVTATAAPGLQKPGIVTAVQWADVDKDGVPDLVLAGEWMPVTIFKNREGNLADVTSEWGLSETTGWWNSLAVHDLDSDGDLDFVAGNLGLNTKYRASVQEPLTVYASDFDRNGRLDAVVCRVVEGKEKPVHQRDELLAQISGLAKKYPRYALYAAASVQEMLGKTALSEAYSGTCRMLESACFIQENGRFTARVLPVPAQTAPVNALLCADFNADHHTDILLTGNSNSPNVSTGQYDAFNGLLLLGDGTGHFRPSGQEQSGFWVDGVGKSLARIRLKSGGHLILAGVNSGRLRAFKLAAQPEVSAEKTSQITIPGRSGSSAKKKTSMTENQISIHHSNNF